MNNNTLHLHLRRQHLAQDTLGHTIWQVETTSLVLPAEHACLLLCDVWDCHWCRGAVERLAVLVPQYNALVNVARQRGMRVIHSPSETMGFYADHPARLRMVNLPAISLPEQRLLPDPPLPIQDEDGGCDTGERDWSKAWTRQHPGVEIDPQWDGISEDIHEIYSFLQQNAIELVIFAGIHTNMCVLNRPFGLKNLARLGIPAAFVRDLTDAMYNPALPPYVAHDEGTRLVIEYIEKFWCATIISSDLTAEDLLTVSVPER